MALKKNETPQVARDRQVRAHAHLKDKVDVLAAFIDAGNVPHGYEWPGWDSRGTKKLYPAPRPFAFGMIQIWRSRSRVEL